MRHFPDNEHTQPASYPEVDPGRCVHGLAEQASCQACVTVCPKEAWVLTDESLGLNEAACDRCGLCVPACPQGAVTLPFEPLQLNWEEAEWLICACEMSDVQHTVGVLPCLHLFSTSDLIRASAEGVAGFMTTSDDCDDCPRGRAPRLAERLLSVNRLLSERGLKPLRLIDLPFEEWQRVRAAAAKAQLHRPVSRRGLLRSLVDTAAERIDMDEARLEEEGPQSPGRWLPEEGDNAVLHWPFSPHIDVEHCSGCDACARICPHQAIRLARDAQGLCYMLSPRDCSGCNLCQDVCESGAAHVDAWQRSAPERLGLAEHRCSVCGVPFHLPDEAAREGGKVVCRICHQVNHHKSLYQVLD